MGRYGRTPEEVYLNPRLNMTAKVVYGVLAMFRNGRTGQCNPSHATLCECLHITETTLKEAIRALVKEGEIIRHYEPGRRIWYEIPRQENLAFGAAEISPSVRRNSAPRGADSSPSSHMMIEQTREHTPAENRNTHDLEDPSPAPAPVALGATGRAPDAVVAASRRLVEYWDVLFPNTSAGTCLPKDIAAMTELQTRCGRSEPQIRALMDHIKAAGTLRYYSRPVYLVRSTGRGDGILGYVRIEIEMGEAARTRNSRPKDAVDEIIERARRRRQEGTP